MALARPAILNSGWAIIAAVACGRIALSEKLADVKTAPCSPRALSRHNGKMGAGSSQRTLVTRP
jgi:hypothetical protein